jgi:hypothetical protein
MHRPRRDASPPAPPPPPPPRRARPQVTARPTGPAVHAFQGGGGGAAAGGGGGGGDDGHLAAALGTKWAHCVNVRLVLERQGERRFIKARSRRGAGASGRLPHGNAWAWRAARRAAHIQPPAPPPPLLLLLLLLLLLPCCSADAHRVGASRRPGNRLACAARPPIPCPPLVPLHPGAARSDRQVAAQPKRGV